VAHEINNPLEAIVNNIYLAKQVKGLPDNVVRYLEVADQELVRVSSLAQQTLGFYRDNAGPAWLNVGKLVDEVLAIYERKLRYKGLRVEREIAPDLRLYTQEGELKQALSNLIANAIDASHDGGCIWVRARSSRQLQSIRISVGDNGIGMSPTVQKQLFTPFFTTKERVGTGLGLWNTKSLMEKQGGRIQVRSRESAGTVMSIILPMASNSEAAEVSAA
jgi:signal transduction histidine kinase